MSLIVSNGAILRNMSKQKLGSIIATSFFTAFFILMISTQLHLTYASDDVLDNVLDNVVTVYKSASCGCCKKWVSHLEANGFKVKSVNSNNMTKIKDENGVPKGARSCHTATVGGYVIEGHVPAADIKKLLAEKRAVAGLAVPGMPMGSPGMEGARKDNYNVYEFDKKGRARVVANY
ncbi:MAG: DUF411 domain-containing protein [Pseudomonadota bacterium]